MFGRKNDGKKVLYSDDEWKIFKSTFAIGGWVLGCFVLGGLLVLAFAYSAPPNSNVLGADLLVGAASAAVGGAVGFIFAIPRTLDPASRLAVASAAAQTGNAATSNAVLAANTNLERVSDWLTTILIGASLVQFTSLVGWIGDLAETRAGAVSRPATGKEPSKSEPTVTGAMKEEAPTEGKQPSSLAEEKKK